MIRLTHLSGSMQGSSSTSPKAVIRIGRGADCDVRFDARLDSRVSTHHAEIRFDNGNYLVVDTGSSNGTLVNGKLVRQQKLRSGDKIVFGAQGGPEVKFEIDNASGFKAVPPAGNGRGYGQPPPMQMGYGQQPPMRAPQQQAPSQDAAMLAQQAQQKIAQARAMTGGQPSGQTMFIMADTLKKVEAVTQKKSGKKWKKVVFGVVLAAFCGFGVLGFIIWQQKQQIEKILQKKDGLDKQRQNI